MKTLLISLFMVYGFQNCLHAETNTTTVKNAHEAKIYHYLKEELKAGYSHGDEGQAMDMDSDYFLVVGEELRKALKNSGFQFLPPEEFEKRIKKLFNLKAEEYTRQSNYDYIDTTTLPFSIEYLRFIPEKGLITMPYKIPEVIDYPTIYPELAIYEKDVNANYSKSGNKEQRVAWNNTHKNYTQYTKNNRAFIVALNKYLLNDDFSQRDWLLNHVYFLLYDLYASERLKDKALIKSLLVTAIASKNQGKLEWHAFGLLHDKLAERIQYLFVLPQKVEGKYVVREEAFDYLEDLIPKEKEKGQQPSKYINVLTQFVKRFKDDQAYGSAVAYMENFIQRMK